MNILLDRSEPHFCISIFLLYNFFVLNLFPLDFYPHLFPFIYFLELTLKYFYYSFCSLWCWVPPFFSFILKLFRQLFIRYSVKDRSVLSKLIAFAHSEKNSTKSSNFCRLKASYNFLLFILVLRSYIWMGFASMLSEKCIYYDEA